MSGWRKIVVDGVQYTWKFGNGVTCVRINGQTFAKFDTTELLGLTPDEHERSIWKKTMSQAVTPALIADAIRNTRNGMPSCLPKEKRKLLSDMKRLGVLRFR
jgi:hypothetical protein